MQIAQRQACSDAPYGSTATRVTLKSIVLEFGASKRFLRYNWDFAQADSDVSCISALRSTNYITKGLYWTGKWLLWGFFFVKSGGWVEFPSCAKERAGK